ncbi:MAG: glycosyltransferase [Anaerolineales bacterium]|nr:glycosyltransferase [Anaerolineales bacterium]
MKILIVTIFFPPLNSVASFRPYSWAKYWSRAGHDVTVLTTKKHEHPTDSPYPFTGFEAREVEMPLFNRLRGALGRENTAKVVGSNNGVKATVLSSLLARANKSIQFLQRRFGVLNYCRMPDLTDLWAARAYQSVSSEQWDLVVSTAWPYTVHQIAYRLRKKGLAKKWIADWRDIWIGNHLYAGLFPFTLIERYYERLWMKKADFITTVSEPLAGILRKRYGDKVSVIYNGFDPEDNEGLPPEKAYPDDGVFRIVYTGSIYAGWQDPSPLFEAIVRLKSQEQITPEHLQVIFYGNNADMTPLANKFNISEYVQYGGFLPRQQSLHFQRDADALLFLEFESKNLRGILTGKLFEYLFAGPPILSVGSGVDDSVGVVLKETGRGESFGIRVDLIAQNIVALMRTQKSGLVPARPLNALQEDPDVFQYSRRRQAGILLGLALD